MDVNGYDYTPIDLTKRPLGGAVADGGNPYSQRPGVITDVTWRDGAAYLNIGTMIPRVEIINTVELRLSKNDAWELVFSDLLPRLPDGPPEWLHAEVGHRFYHVYESARWPLGGDKTYRVGGQVDFGAGTIVIGEATASLDASHTVLRIGQVFEHEYWEQIHLVALDAAEAIDLVFRLLPPVAPTHTVTIVAGGYSGNFNGEVECLDLNVELDWVYQTAEGLGYVDDGMFLLFTPLGEDSGVPASGVVGTFEVEAH